MRCIDFFCLQEYYKLIESIRRNFHGKGKKDRYTVLPQASLEMLRKYYKMYKPKHPEGYIFLNREGRPLTVERTRIFFRRYRRKAKIDEKFVVHSLRHRIRY